MRNDVLVSYHLLNNTYLLVKIEPQQSNITASSIHSCLSMSISSIYQIVVIPTVLLGTVFSKLLSG